MAQESDLTALVDELYARPPAEFVARRDELAREARASGDRALAAQIKALRRPSVGAWYLNSAVRAGLASLDDLLRLGRELRDAQGRGDFPALRELGARRGPLTSAVVREVSAHLAGAGVAITSAGLEEARTTLVSALADPEVADELSRGRLDRPHVYAGFGDLAGLTPSVASTTAPSGQTDDLERRAAEEAVARKELAEAEAELAAATTAREAAEAEAARAKERVDALTSELAGARDAVRAAEKQLDTARRRHADAEKRREHARRRLPQASD